MTAKNSPQTYTMDSKVVFLMMFIALIGLFFMAFRYKNKQPCNKIDFSFRTANKFDVAFSNEAVFFSAMSQGAERWQWDYGDNTPVDKTSGPYPSHIYKKPGVYTVRLKINNECEEIKTININSREKEGKKLVIRVQWPPEPLYAGREYYFTDSTTGAETWSWFFDNEPKRSRQSLAYQFLEPGSHKVVLVINDGNNRIERTFNIAIKRTSFTQFYDNDISLFKSRKQYSTGDLIFFKTNINRATRKNRVTHVGLYLTNGYFVQSSNEGVNIANLQTGYWRNHFVAAGRLKESFYQRAGLKVPDGAVEESTNMYVAEEDSKFDAPLIPESYDSLIKKYAAILGVPGEKIKLPELFVFLDSVGKKPFTASNCMDGSIRSTCMISALYQSVFNVSVNAKSLAAYADSTVDVLKQSDQLAEGDIVYFKSLPYLKEYNQAGIFLYNNKIAYIDGEKLVFASITEDSKLKNYPKMYARLQADLLKQAGQNLTKRRRAADSLATANTKIVETTDSPEKKVVIPLQAFTTPLSESIQKSIAPYRENVGENNSPIVIRYARQLKVDPSNLKNPLLYLFADKWLNTPLRNRGCTDKRMSHECFAMKYYAEVYDQPIELSDIAALNGLYADPVDDRSTLKEGDLLFFGTKSAGKNKAEFLGIYLGGKYFLCLSPFTSKVSICETDDPLYKQKFISVARPVR